MTGGRRVVVTGLGIVTSIGIGIDDFWSAAVVGRSGIRRISAFDVSGCRSQIAGEVERLPEASLKPQQAEQLDRVAQFALVATHQALRQAGSLSGYDPYRVGVMVGTGIGGYTTLESLVSRWARKEGRLPPVSVPKSMVHAAAAAISIEHQLKGVTLTHSTACSSGVNAIGQAYQQIAWGQADAMIAGGSEACVLPTMVLAFGELRALSQSFNDAPAGASRPFDAKRDGFVLGEGAGFVVLEELKAAEARGAPILAEVIGYSVTSEARHLVMPDASGNEAAKTMRMAIADAGITPQEVDYINAHATSTPTGDIGETNAIKLIFGERAHRIPISATKSMIGHTIGAAGAIGTIVSVLSIGSGMIHPTINQQAPDPACDLDYVPNRAREHNVRVALTNSFGFGGNNAAIVLRRFE